MPEKHPEEALPPPPSAVEAGEVETGAVAMTAFSGGLRLLFSEPRERF